MQIICGRTWRLGVLGVLVIAAAGAAYWLVSTKPATPPARSAGRSQPQG